MVNERIVIGRKKKTNIKEKLLFAADIFFADAKGTFQRVMCLGSALFWTWLELTFFVFFFTYAFGLAGYIVGGSYAYSFETIRNNKELVDALIKCFVLIIFVFRIPFHYKKEINKRQ